MIAVALKSTPRPSAFVLLRGRLESLSSTVLLTHSPVNLYGMYVVVEGKAPCQSEANHRKSTQESTTSLVNGRHQNLTNPKP